MEGMRVREESTGDCTKRPRESVRAYTYGISTVGSVLDLCLMKFHLLLRQHLFHFRVFCAYDLQEILCERLRALHLLLVGATGV